jgi:hypothetical protein
MDGKFYPKQELHSGGKEVVVSGPISWDDEVTNASLHVAIMQGKVAATGRTANDLSKGTNEFFVTATVEGNGRLHAGDAIATGWALLRGEGIGMYEWSVPVKLENGTL